MAGSRLAVDVYWDERRILRAAYGRLAPAARKACLAHLKRDESGTNPRLEEIKEAVETACMFAAEYEAAHGDLDARSPAWVKTSLAHSLAKAERDKGFDVYERPAKPDGRRPYKLLMAVEGIRVRKTEDDEDGDDDYRRQLENPDNAIGAVEDSNPEATEARREHVGQVVRSALARIEAEYGTVAITAVWLHLVEEWTFTAVAGELSVPRSTVQSWCRKIATSLKNDPEVASLLCQSRGDYALSA